MASLSQKIITTLAYYDILDYPMSAFEIWKYLLVLDVQSNAFDVEEEKRVSLSDIIKEMDGTEISKYIEEYRGFYFLKGRKNLVSQRIEKNKISEKKFKIIKRTVRFLRFVPFVRAIAVTGRVAMKNAGAESDLDLLIILRHGKIFTGRTLVTLLTHIIGRRRHGKKVANRICLNYFVTDGSLEIGTKDLFSSSEYSFIFPMFGLEVFQKFQLANRWIADFKENYRVDELANPKILKDGAFSKNIRKVGEKIFSFNFIEKALKSWEIKRIKKDPRTKKAGSMVMADDNALVFLPEPQGPGVYERFKEKLAEIGNGAV